MTEDDARTALNVRVWSAILHSVEGLPERAARKFAVRHVARAEIGGSLRTPLGDPDLRRAIDRVRHSAPADAGASSWVVQKATRTNIGMPYQEARVEGWLGNARPLPTPCRCDEDPIVHTHCERCKRVMPAEAFTTYETIDERFVPAKPTTLCRRDCPGTKTS